MRKALAGAAAAFAVAGAVLIPAVSGASGGKTVHVTQTIVGAEISGTQTVFKAHDSYSGNGAGVQTLKVSGSNITSTTTVYFGNATGTAKGPVKLGTANAQGIAPITGSGHETGGTGKLKGVKGKFTVTGTLNTKTLVFKAKTKGTITLP